jgi:hypothetical protein
MQQQAWLPKAPAAGLLRRLTTARPCTTCGNLAEARAYSEGMAAIHKPHPPPHTHTQFIIRDGCNQRHNWNHLACACAHPAHPLTSVRNLSMRDLR